MESSMKSFVIDGSERSVQDVVSRLKFISKIQEGEKIDVQSLVLCEPGTKTSLYRTLIARNESRERSLEFFRNTIGEAFELATKYLHRKEIFFKEIGGMIITALQECKIGLKNSTKTYADDKMFISKIDTLISTLNTKSRDLNRQLTSELSKVVKPEIKLDQPMSKPVKEKEKIGYRRF